MKGIRTSGIIIIFHLSLDYVTFKLIWILQDILLCDVSNVINHKYGYFDNLKVMGVIIILLKLFFFFFERNCFHVITVKFWVMTTLHKKHSSLKVHVKIEIVLDWEMLLFIELYEMNHGCLGKFNFKAQYYTNIFK